MTRHKHDLPSIRRPPAHEKQLLRLYNERLEREKEAVDIDAVHHKIGKSRNLTQEE